MADDHKNEFRAIADAYAAKVEASKSFARQWQAAEQDITTVLEDAVTQFTSSGRTIGKSHNKDGEIALGVIGLKGGIQQLSYRPLAAESQVIVTERLDSGTRESEISIGSLSKALIVSHVQVFLKKALKIPE